MLLEQFAQELLSTFGNSLGEVALQPSTGGTFIVKLYHASPLTNVASSSLSTAISVVHDDGNRASGENVNTDAEGREKGRVVVNEYLLWDRKAEGGFPGMVSPCVDPTWRRI